MTAETIARALGGHKSGASYIAQCPAHEDKTPSLSITERDGKLLVKCFAGCDQAAVVRAMKALGLWPEQERRESPLEWGTLVTTYRYTDAHGELLYQICRFRDPKGFRPRYPDGRGGWIWRKHPREVLYHLPEVLEACIAFVVEGERDAETMREHGFCATTNAGGANAPWLDSYTETLRDKEVILIPDRDRPGRERVLRIAHELLHKVARLVILELEDGKDVTEWFQRGHSELELIAQLDAEEVSR